MSLRRATALLSILAGAVLILFFWNAQWGWFQGGPLGIALLALGTLELFEGGSGRPDQPGGLMGTLKRELSDAVGLKPDSSSEPGNREDETKPRGTTRP